MRRDDSNTGCGCFHIVRWHGHSTCKIRAKPALKRCFKSKSTADTIRIRGIKGDRSPDHLDAHDPAWNRLGVVECDRSICECTRWPTGCNAANLPTPPEKEYLPCAKCNVLRRKVIEVTDPRDEEPRLYCRKHAMEKVLAINFSGRQPVLRWRHADDDAMFFLTVTR